MNKWPKHEPDWLFDEEAYNEKWGIKQTETDDEEEEC